MKTLGERLKFARTARGLTQAQLVEKATGVDQKSISAIENRPSKRSQHAPKLAKALGVRLEWLTDGEEPMEADTTYQSLGDRIGTLQKISQKAKPRTRRTIAKIVQAERDGRLDDRLLDIIDDLLERERERAAS